MRRGLGRASMELISVLRRIKGLDLSSDLKRRILGTYVATFCLGRWDRGRHVARILGHPIHFLSLDWLEVLFYELFIDQSYHFTCDNRAPLIIDCGSNIGMSVLYFKTLYPRSRILAFEPDTTTFSCLEENIRNNGFTDVQMVRAALASENGQINFYYEEDRPGSLEMSTSYERMPKQRQVVRSVRLSEHVLEEVDFLKMDIEGAELSVMDELKSAGKLSSIRQMVIEYHHHIVKDEDRLSAMLGLLEESGFGYQIESKLGRPLPAHQFQDVLIYAYRRPAPGKAASHSAVSEGIVAHLG